MTRGRPKKATVPKCEQLRDAVCSLLDSVDVEEYMEPSERVAFEEALRASHSVQSRIEGK